MKNLSIEEKVKRYDEALKQIKECMPDENGFVTIYPDEIFPELKESEDEKIRKEIIKLVKFFYGSSLVCKHTISKDKMVAWLEKQGEQMPNDKVEPKFRVGDWVRAISSGNIFKILSVNNGLYRVLCYDGVEANYPIKDVDYDLAYWTIQDAKDGDVIYCKKDDMEIIVMYSGINIHNNVDSYCRYNSKLGFNTHITNVLDAEHDFITPATKEQRDLLFQKMKEAGYKWNAKKKELKKIEQNSSWSEEDEKMKNLIISTLTSMGTLNLERYHHMNLDEVKKWLKSLKSNHWKPSEEQLNEVKKAIRVTGTNGTVLLSLYNVLKKL